MSSLLNHEDETPLTCISQNEKRPPDAEERYLALLSSESERITSDKQSKTTASIKKPKLPTKRATKSNKIGSRKGQTTIAAFVKRSNEKQPTNKITDTVEVISPTLTSSEATNEQKIENNERRRVPNSENVETTPTENIVHYSPVCPCGNTSIRYICGCGHSFCKWNCSYDKVTHLDMCVHQKQR